MKDSIELSDYRHIVRHGRAQTVEWREYSFAVKGDIRSALEGKIVIILWNLGTVPIVPGPAATAARF
jgi:hypothetical protein